jgi:hypothetical protein
MSAFVVSVLLTGWVAPAAGAGEHRKIYEQWAARNLVTVEGRNNAHSRVSRATIGVGLKAERSVPALDAWAGGIHLTRDASNKVAISVSRFDVSKVHAWEIEPLQPAVTKRLGYKYKSARSFADKAYGWYGRVAKQGKDPKPATDGADAIAKDQAPLVLHARDTSGAKLTAITWAVRTRTLGKEPIPVVVLNRETGEVNTFQMGNFGLKEVKTDGRLGPTVLQLLNDPRNGLDAN